MIRRKKRISFNGNIKLQYSVRNTAVVRNMGLQRTRKVCTICYSGMNIKREIFLKSVLHTQSKTTITTTATLGNTTLTSYLIYC